MLLQRHASGRISQVSGFVESCYELTPGTLRDEFDHLEQTAPRRDHYIGERDISKRFPNSNRLEELLGHQLYVDKARLTLGDHESIEIVDFQTPLKSRRSDPVGKVDLLGWSDRPWVIELKVLRPNRSADTPLSAALEALSYAAVVRANRVTLNNEARSLGFRSGFDNIEVLVLAPDSYWSRWDESPAARGWREGLRHVSELTTESLPVELHFGSMAGSQSDKNLTNPLGSPPSRSSASSRRRLRRTAHDLENKQAEWAAKAAIPMRDRRHTKIVDDNLFQPLSDIGRADIQFGDGAELDETHGPARLSSLRSSTALVLNVFDPWVGRDSVPLSDAIGTAPLSKIRFEGKYPTGLGRAANLDVVLHPEKPGAPLTAIEAKFIEPYDGQTNSFRSSYFEPQRANIWNGLPNLKAEASAIHLGDSNYQQLKTAQLIKHSIGLQRAYGSDSFELLYLWYQPPGEEESKHREELARFQAIAELDIRFRVLTYNALIRSLTDEPVAGYFEYLANRYDLAR